MQHGKIFALRAAMVIACGMLSACAVHDLPPPPTVPDSCLTFRRVTVAPAPSVGVDDPGNAFDTDETVQQVLENNEVLDRLCPR